MLPDDVLRSLNYLDLDPVWFEGMATEAGIDCARRMVDRYLESAAVFELWFPRLQAFATERRATSLVHAHDKFTPAQQAKRRILASLIRIRHPSLRAIRQNANIYVTNGEALDILETEWPAQTKNAVLLAASDWEIWQASCSPPSTLFGWFDLCSWTITDGVADDCVWRVLDWSPPELEPGQTLWLVESAFSKTIEVDLWGWDGSRERFLEHVASVEVD